MRDDMIPVESAQGPEITGLDHLPEVPVDDEQGPKRPSGTNGLWGWTSYTATGWRCKETDKKIYRGRFLKIDGLFPVGPNAAMEKRVITFCAARPVLAMREIARRLNDGEPVRAYDAIN